MHKHYGKQNIVMDVCGKPGKDGTARQNKNAIFTIYEYKGSRFYACFLKDIINN
jgi:hypothetical protein